MTERQGETEPGVTGDPATSYEQAARRLDEIISRLDSGSAELRETLELCAEARGLIEYCAGELAAVDQGLRELRLDELADSLAGTSSPDPAASPEPARDASPPDPVSPGPPVPDPDHGPAPADDDIPF